MAVEHKMSWTVMPGAPLLYDVSCICGWFKATYAATPETSITTTYERHLTDPTWGYGNPASPPSPSFRFDSEGRPVPVPMGDGRPTYACPGCGVAVSHEEAARFDDGQVHPSDINLSLIVAARSS